MDEVAQQLNNAIADLKMILDEGADLIVLSSIPTHVCYVLVSQHVCAAY